MFITLSYLSCIYQCKDTNFKANHNQAQKTIWAKRVVFTNAKILILKLITTLCDEKQSYKRCIYQCKDTNFKANHNGKPVCRNARAVVFTNAKILILKLITTLLFRLFSVVRCIYQCKDTNFKANHNRTAEGTSSSRLYLPMQRY